MEKKKIDPVITFVPLISIIFLSLLFFLFPEDSNEIIGKIRFFLCSQIGVYYLIIGLAVFLISIYMAASRYGDIKLGEKDESPKYSFFSWGAMMFTCGLAADILFYSFSEWILYAADPYMKELGSVQKWAGVFPVFHWSLIPWSFYLTLAVAFGFMLHVRKKKRQRYSEACRSVIGRHTDGLWGRMIDLLAVFALIAGTATTFSIATPLMAEIVNKISGSDIDRRIITVVILLITCVVYTYSLLKGIQGIDILAKACILLFFGIQAYVLIFGSQARYIIESGLSQIGTMLGNFMELSTYTDPLRTSSFPQNWTMYYWAYWMVWCVASPFFIGAISRGRTVRQLIVGGYLFGTGSTITSFIILGNYSMGRQMAGISDFIGGYINGGDIYALIMDVIDTLPFAPVVFIFVLLTMIAFYATSFDSIAYIASCYSYHELGENEKPHKSVELMWCILLILLPITLVFSESSMSNIQSVSIIAAFPIGIVILLIIAGFFKDGNNYIKENRS